MVRRNWTVGSIGSWEIGLRRFAYLRMNTRSSYKHKRQNTGMK